MADDVASGSEYGLSIVEETTPGTTPTSPEFEPVRQTGIDPTHDRPLLISKELNNNRQISGGRLGNNTIGGVIDSELSFASFDDILEAVLCSIRQNIRATTISALDTDDSFNDSGSNLPILAVGDTFEVTGFTEAANNDTFTVLTSTASKLTTDGGVLTAEAAGDDIRIVSTEIKAGTARRSFTLEDSHPDLTAPEWHRYLGSEFSSLSMSIKPNALIEMKADFVSQTESKGTAILSGATYKTISTTDQFANFDGTLDEGGSAIAEVSAIDFKIDNTLERNFVVTSQDSLRPSIGQSNVNGSMTVLFTSKALLDKFTAETESSLLLTLTDPAGNVLTVNIPRIKYTGGKLPKSGTGSLAVTLPFQAFKDTTEDSNIVITRVPA